MKTDLEMRQNLRQTERPLKLGIHDISCAKYFIIKDQPTFMYSLRAPQYGGIEYIVSHLDDGSHRTIGFATPDRNKIVIKVRTSGLNWISKISLSDIKIYGQKLPTQ